MNVLLRLYLRFGFEHLRQRIRLGAPRNYVAVYGTLMRSVAEQITNQELREEARAARTPLGAYLGSCRIKGRLVDLGEYPGLVPDDSGTVAGELYELPFGKSGEALDQFRAAIREIDRYEEIDVEYPDRSEYTRRFVKLASPADAAAWVYFLNRPRSNPVPVPSGEWKGTLRAAAEK
jgi:gamma-glutamylcyclotransferase (GGCT)/AIG2-like uncharacterized protein YtfP